MRVCPPPIAKFDVPALSKGRVLVVGEVKSATPPASLTRLDGARPLIGRLSICVASMLNPSEAVAVCRSVRSAATVIVSLNEPTFSVKSIGTRCPAPSGTRSRRVLANPVSSAETL